MLLSVECTVLSLIFKLAFRNVFKYRKRTAVLFAVIFIAVLATQFMYAFMDAFTGKTLEDLFDGFGHAVFNKDGYKAKAKLYPLDFSIEETAAILTDLLQVEGIKSVRTSVIFGALAEGTEYSIPLICQGISVGDDPTSKRFRDNLLQGTMLGGPTEGVIIGDELAELLDKKTGDTVMLITQDYYGSPNPIELHIAGIANTHIKAERSQMIIMPIKTAVDVLHLPGAAITIQINFTDRKQLGLQAVPGRRTDIDTITAGLAPTISELAARFKTDEAAVAGRVRQVIMDGYQPDAGEKAWLKARKDTEAPADTTVPVFGPGTFLVPGLSELSLLAIAAKHGLELNTYVRKFAGFMDAMALADIFILFTAGLIVLIAGTTIINTVLTSVFERYRDFGTLRAVGLGRSGLFAVILIEAAFNSLLAVIAVNALTIPVFSHFARTGIDFGASMDTMEGVSTVVNLSASWTVFAKGSLVGLGAGIVSAVYPAFIAVRKSVVEALKYV